MVSIFSRKKKERIEKGFDELRNIENLVTELDEKIKIKEIIEKLENIEDLNEFNKQIETKNCIKEYEERISQLEAENEILKKVNSFPLIKNPIIESTLVYLLDLYEELEKNYYEKIPGTRAETIVFSHRDGDGISSSALVERSFANDIKFFYIHQPFRNLIATVIPEKNFIVADLILSKSLAKYLKNLYESGVNVKWIDHHEESLKIPEELLNYLKEKGVLIWGDAKSAASLCYEHFKLNDEISKQIKLIAERCDGDRSKETEKVKEESILLSKLTNLEPSLADDLRKELARFGSIENEKIKKKARVCDLLTAYGEKILKENILYDTKNFQVFTLDKLPKLIGINRIMSNISHQTGKDVYIISEKNDSIEIKGYSKIANKVFPESKGRRRIGHAFVKERNEFLSFLEKIYENEEKLRGIYRAILNTFTPSK